jgi:hypothetical protein
MKLSNELFNGHGSAMSIVVKGMHTRWHIPQFTHIAYEDIDSTNPACSPSYIARYAIKCLHNPSPRTICTRKHILTSISHSMKQRWGDIVECELQYPQVPSPPDICNPEPAMGVHARCDAMFMENCLSSHTPASILSRFKEDQKNFNIFVPI